MPLELLGEMDHVPGAPEVPNGWRGVIDFGETWTRADEGLWPPHGRPFPDGEPLTYGCEVTRDSDNEPRISIRIFFLDAPRKAMAPGAAFTLRDGRTERANGKLL
jgi:hypothetical protein